MQSSYHIDCVPRKHLMVQMHLSSVLPGISAFIYRNPEKTYCLSVTNDVALKNLAFICRSICLLYTLIILIPAPSCTEQHFLSVLWAVGWIILECFIVPIRTILHYGNMQCAGRIEIEYSEILSEYILIMLTTFKKSSCEQNIFWESSETLQVVHSIIATI